MFVNYFIFFYNINYLLQHCPARFKRKDRLGRHMLIHDLTKRLKCPFRTYLGCMSEFSRPDKLKRHLLTHSNIKRFSCSHCNRNFHRAQALKHHEMNKHNLKCEICSHVSIYLIEYNLNKYLFYEIHITGI